MKGLRLTLDFYQLIDYITYLVIDSAKNVKCKKKDGIKLVQSSFPSHVGNPVSKQRFNNCLIIIEKI